MSGLVNVGELGGRPGGRGRAVLVGELAEELLAGRQRGQVNRADLEPHVSGRYRVPCVRRAAGVKPRRGELVMQIM